ncbi:MAG: hypothetical protein HKN47_20065, partial [Pirellulaceae bacterium]|nr:hypothetical protein [Pirellulaceae bacterium]
MLRKLTHYLTALIVLLVAAIAYNSAAEKWLRPPRVQTVPMAEGPQLTADETLADLFPEGAWQRGMCKRLQTEDGVLLFQRWEQVADDQWKLWPVTLVVGRGTSQQQDRDPIILEAAEGAEIRFAESLDMMSGGAPPIKRGRMMGLVEIRRESTDPDTKPLLIQTTNVGIDNRKLWTTEPIHMRLGDARMVGRDLTLHLSSSPGASSGGRGAAAVLDRMELIYLDELFIPLEKNALAKSQAKLAAESSTSGALAPASATPSSTYPAALSFKCDGRIEYDFTLDRLTLQD